MFHTKSTNEANERQEETAAAIEIINKPSGRFINYEMARNSWIFFACAGLTTWLSSSADSDFRAPTLP